MLQYIQVQTRKNEIIKNDTFKPLTKWMVDFLEIHCYFLMGHAVSISKSANLHFYSNDPKHKGKYDGEYIRLFRFLDQFDNAVISLKLVRDNDSRLAIKMRNYCVDRIDELISRLEKDLFIKTQWNPIVVHFKEIKTKFEKCIDINEEIYVNGSLPQELVSENLDNNPNLKWYESNIKKSWFQNGLLWANGEMDSLRKKYGDRPPTIAKKIGKPKIEKWILASIQEYKGTNSSKNIFYDRSKMQMIIDYCRDNNIEITPSFLNKLPPEST